ncbi:hypothetical protein RsTz2092_05090 [Deferribacterales bacterium RsTz2092]|nr:hypothetical protein AGMMS49941_03920 [Deferribacterales bacterium]
MISTNSYVSSMLAGVQGAQSLANSPARTTPAGRLVSASMAQKLAGQLTGYPRIADRLALSTDTFTKASDDTTSLASLLERMRSLAQQAIGASVSNRLALQDELNSIKSEINSLVNQSAANTQKLLNGEMSGYGASTDRNVSAVFRGQLNTGAYRFDYSLNPGSNAVYGTNPFRIRASGATTTNTSTLTLPPFSWGRYPTPARQDAETAWNGATVEFSNAEASYGGAQRIQLVDRHVTNAAIPSLFMRFDTMNPDAGYATQTAIVPPNSCYIEFEWLSDHAANDSSAINYRLRRLDAVNGDRIEFTSSVMPTNPLTNPETTIGGFLSLILPRDIMQTTSGDKFLFYMEGDFSLSDEVLVIDTPTTTGDYSYYNDGVVEWYETNIPSQMRIKLNAGNNAATGGSAWLVTLDAAGFHENEITWTPAMTLNNVYDATPTTGTWTAGTPTTPAPTGGAIAAKTTQLKDIWQLYDSAGNFLLATPQTIALNGNGRSASIELKGDDTIESFVQKLRNAIANQLKMANGIGDSFLAQYFSSAGTFGDVGIAAGTIGLQGAIAGANSQLSIDGNSSLLSLLGLNTLKGYKSSSFRAANIIDASTGKLLGARNSYDGYFRDIAHNVDVYIAQPDNSVRATAKAGAGYSINYTSMLVNKDVYINVVDGSMRSSVGVGYPAQTRSAIGRLDTAGLELNDISVGSAAQARVAYARITDAIARVRSMGRKASMGKSSMDTLNAFNKTAEEETQLSITSLWKWG